MVSQQSKDLKTMKFKKFHSSLEARELMVMYRGTDRSVQQALQARVMKKYDHEKSSRIKEKASRL